MEENNSLSLKDFLIALSLANLCYIRVWSQLLSDSSRYFIKYAPEPLSYLALIINVILLSCLFFTLITIMKRTQNRYVYSLTGFIYFLIMLIPVYGIIKVVPYVPRTAIFKVLGPRGLLLTAIVSVLLLIFFVIRVGHKRIIHALSVLLIILFPLVPVTFSNALLVILKDQPVKIIPDKPMAPLIKESSPGVRVLWVIFDELDQRVTFIDRPGTLNLPNFDLLRKEAFFSTNAHPPAGDTLLSIPSLTTGRLVSKALPLKDELMIRYDDETFGWSTRDNVFAKARELGFNTSITGWYHPYGRVLNKSLSSCYWESYIIYDDEERGLWGILLKQSKTLLETVPLLELTEIPNMLMPEIQIKQDRSKHILKFSRLLDRAKKDAADPDLGLIMLHLPVPHRPYIYNRFTDEVSLEADIIAGYLDNLKLADSTLGQLKEILKNQNMWDNTAVIVTSDHWWRKSGNYDGKVDGRIPFIIKLPNQTQGSDYDSPVNTIITGELIISILRGEIAKPEELSNWLLEHSKKPQ